MTTSEVEPEPEGVSVLAGEHVEKLRRFTSSLAEHGEALGLIGPLERQRIWTRHVINCALLAPLLPPGTVADIGSGAGLPGLVLAILKPENQFVLVEPMERRVKWLTDQARVLDLTNVRVIRARAEEIRGTERFNCVTARAVSALKKLIPMTVPLLAEGGELIFMKGQRVDEEMQAAQGTIKKHRLMNARSELVSADGVAEQTRVFRATVDSVPS